MIGAEVQDKTFLQEYEKMKNLKNTIEKTGYTTESLSRNEEDDMFELIVKSNNKDNYKNNITIGRNLIYSSDYQKCLMLNSKIKIDDIPPFEIHTNDSENKPDIIDNKIELLKHLIEDGKKGVNIQRYKGLGEMNPEQLWQTTMHPDRRNLLKVTVEDAVESDEIFTILMGDDVEPRREFIQNNALEVSMLDI